MTLDEFISRKKLLLAQFERGYKDCRHTDGEAAFPSEQDEAAWHDHFSFWLREIVGPVEGHPEMAYDTAPKVLPTLSLDSELQSLASESLDRWDLRVACFTGYDDKPQSDESLHIKAKQLVRAAKALCHYSNGGSPINSCCAIKYRCRSAATVAAIVRFGDGSPM